MSSNNKLKILVVEDNQVNQLMAQGTLSHLGHEVAVANDGSEAVESSAHASYDIILMDLMMPVMDGFEASRTILENFRKEGKDAPTIIALTASLTDEDKDRCRQHGMLRWLKKPIDLDEFQNMMAELVSGTGQKVEAPTADDDREEETVRAQDLLARIRNPIARQKIIDLFTKSYPDRLQELASSLNKESASVARRAAHTLKGNFLNFAASRGARLTHELETCLENEDWQQARERLPALEAECAEVVRVLQSYSSETTTEQKDYSTEPLTGYGFTVIVADVDPANRAICSAALESEGYKVVEASDGEQVLKLLEDHAIDVVMMGVLMEKLGGFETCRRIKAQEETRMLPVLLVTALEEREARFKGMDAGADDFISKPIEPREVSLRVRNAARGKGLYDKLQSSFEELKQLEELRDGLTHMLVHDLRTPLTAIKGYASLLAAGFGQELSDQQKTFAKKIVNQSNRLVDMVSAILDVSRLESDDMPLDLKPTNFSELLLEQAEQFEGLPDYEMRTEVSNVLEAPCDADLIKRVVANLLSNAFKYSPKGEEVLLRLCDDGDWVLIEIQDKGPGVPEALRERIFDKFTQVEEESHKRPYSSGLGLTFCKLVVEKHGGNIGVDEAEGGGSRFWLRLPKTPVAQEVTPNSEPNA